MRKFGFPLPPLVIAMMLGFKFETNLRTALLMSRGDPQVFFTSPISVTCILLALVVVAFTSYRNFVKS
jgi:putative tricarboxylic transport membrane protein